MASWEEYLKAIYYAPKHPASFARPPKLYKVMKDEGQFNIGIHRIRKILHNQEAYSLHKPAVSKEITSWAPERMTCG